MRKSTTLHLDSEISEPQHDLPGSEIFFAPARKKIALVASITWTLWNYRLSLVQALEKEGYEVILIAADDPSRIKFESQTDITFLPLRQINRRSLSLLTNFKLLLELYFTLRRAKPDIVLFFTIRPNTLGNFAARALGIPTISTIEGMGISGSAQWWLRKVAQSLYRLALGSARKVVFLNQEDLDEFVDKKIVSESMALLIPGSGVDLDHFSPKKKSEKTKVPVFLFVARLLAEKGIREFANAARILKQDGIKAECRVLGSPDAGNPTSIDVDEISAWVQEGILQYDGFVDDVRTAIAEADVVVLPSYYREGVPRSVLEGMAMGKPIITTNSVGCRDTVEEGINGYLVPPRDAQALAAAMKKMVSLSESKLQEMGRNSLDKVTREFADQCVLPRYAALIRSELA